MFHTKHWFIWSLSHRRKDELPPLGERIFKNEDHVCQNSRKLRRTHNITPSPKFPPFFVFRIHPQFLVIRLTRKIIRVYRTKKSFFLVDDMIKFTIRLFACLFFGENDKSLVLNWFRLAPTRIISFRRRNRQWENTISKLCM